MTVKSADGGPGALIDLAETGRGLMARRAFWAGYGVVLAVMGGGVLWNWPPDLTHVVELLINAAIFALLAQPYQGRPVVTAMRLPQLAEVHRNTLLVGLFAILVATEEPPVWAAGVDALLLAGYLLLMDMVTIPYTVMRRLAAPAYLVGLLALIAGSTALVALPASDSTYRPFLVAGAAAAGLTAAVATAFGPAGSRRVGSRGTDHQKQDRSPR